MRRGKRDLARRGTQPKSKKAQVLVVVLDDFPLFPKLPAELRDMIWAESVEPQIVAITNASYEVRPPRQGYLRYKTVVRAKPSYSVPAILHANQESRMVGLKHWSLEFESQLPRPVYFNFSRDALFMDNFDALLAFYGGPWGSPNEDRSSIKSKMMDLEKNLKHLIIGETIPEDFVAKKIISRLYNLEGLTLPRPFAHGFAADSEARNLAEKIKGWMVEKQNQYSQEEGVFDEWTLPEFKFLTQIALKDLDEAVEKLFMRSEARNKGTEAYKECKQLKRNNLESSVPPLCGGEESVSTQREIKNRRLRGDETRGGYVNRFGRPAMWLPTRLPMRLPTRRRRN